MRVYYDQNLTYFEPRPHPYGAAPGGHRYVDFKERPDLIRTVLEDFQPFDRTNAVQKFYAMLEWVNGSNSKIETNDCAFRSAGSHKDPNSTKNLRAHGRLCILHRDPYFNSDHARAVSLCEKIMENLIVTDPTFTAEDGVVGLTLNPILQLSISTAQSVSDKYLECSVNDPGLGNLTMLSFWVYGKDADEVFSNLERILSNMWSTFRAVSDWLKDR